MENTKAIQIIENTMEVANFNPLGGFGTGIKL